MAQFPSTTAADGIWTLKKVRRAILGDNWPPLQFTDEYWANTVLLLNADGASNAGQNNTFLDSSSNAHTITRNGNATQGSFSPFSVDDGKWGNYFDETGDYLTIPTTTDVTFGTGDFTIEGWAQFGVTPASNPQGLFHIGSGYLPSNGNGPALHVNASNVWNAYIGGNNYSAVTGVNTGQWYHFAYVRNSGTTTIYVDGTSVISQADTTNYTESYLAIGGIYSTAYLLNGNISNFRIVKGTAVYTSAFTPPTAPLTAISGTSLLTCQSNRFIDNSTNAHAITVNGNPKVTTFSPFPQTLPYSADTNGGSGYFDGTGDYLTVPNNTDLILGTGDCTIECWVYPLAVNASNANPILNKLNGASNNGWLLGMSNTGLWQFSTGSNVIVRAGTVVLNTWTHLAAVRESGTTTLYVNGVSVGTTASVFDFTDTVDLFVGFNSSFVAVNAYVSNARIIKGTALYTSAFTPPTAPLTNVTNTSLLCNFTNASITDLTGSNVLETVGDAQVDTTTFKYGTGALEFDGTGDYLSIPDSDDFVFGSGDFTIEFWARINATGTQVFFDTRPSDNSGTPLVIYTTSSSLIFATPSTTRITGGTLSIDTWYHITLCRSGTSTKMFIDGTQTGSTYTDSNVYTCGANRPLIGIAGYSFGAAPLNGYIDDLRITKGIARYTANFTPPTAELPVVGE